MKPTPESHQPSGPRALNLQALVEAARKRQFFAPSHTPKTPAEPMKPTVQRFQARGVPYSALND